MHFVNQYMAHQLISILEDKSVDSCKTRLIDLFTKIRAFPDSKLSQACLYQVFLAMLSNKELKTDSGLI